MGEFKPEDLVDPLDYLLIDLLPLQGTLYAGVYPEGMVVSDMKSKIGDGSVPSGTIAGRLKTLELYGLVVNRAGVGTSGKRIWQATPAGQAEVKRWKQEAGDATS